MSLDHDLVRPGRRAGHALIAAALALGCALAPLGPVAALAADGGDQAAFEGDAAYNPDAAPEISSPAGILVDRDTGTVLYAKDADAKRYPASTTKVMTALLTIENANLDDVVTIEESDLTELGEDSMMSGLLVGEQYTVKDLLACLLLPSGNDAAYVLARYVGGSWQAFVDMMNEKAASLGCTGTHFANPCGLHDDDHYTTARDLVRIFDAALDEPTFVRIAGSATWDLPATEKQAARTLETTDFLIDPTSPAYMDGKVTAGKTGYTLEGGKCLVAAAENGERRVAGVVLGAENDPDADGVTPNFYDMKNLLEWGLDAWTTGNAVSVGDGLASVAVKYSEDGDSVELVSQGDVYATLPAGVGTADLEVEGGLPSEVDAPVSAGSDLGTVDVLYEGRYLGTVSVATSTALGYSWRLFALDWVSDPVHAALVAAAVAVAVGLVVALAVSASLRKKRCRARELSAKAAHVPAAPAAKKGAAAKAAGAKKATAKASNSPKTSGKHFKE